MNDTLADENARLEWCLLSTSGEVICRDNIDVRLEKNSSAKLAEVSLKGVAFDPVNISEAPCGDTIAAHHHSHLPEVRSVVEKLSEKIIRLKYKKFTIIH